ncbi:MAG: hypothetical protein HY290_20255 [Planctomycetia bacterium]|nr:hypothetical protein [Planctomycetia bacterium]
MNALSTLLQYIATPFKQLLAIPLEIVSTPRRMMGLSLPKRAAILVFLVFTVMATVVFFLWWKNPERIETVHFWPAVGTVSVLIVMSTIVVHYMVSSWLEHDVSGFPDIDEAWEQGLAELSAAGFKLGELPLFLVLGVPDEGPAKSLLAAAGVGLEVNAVPAGERSALRWFAGPNCAILVVSHASRLSRLVARAQEPPEMMAPADAGGHGLGTLQVPSEYGRTAAPGFGGGFEAGEKFSGSEAPFPGGDQSTITNPGAKPAYMAGTLTPDSSHAGNQPHLHGVPSGPSVRGRTAPVSLTKEQAETASVRLDHVCRLLRKERLPLCPINGILTVLPFDLIARGDQEASEVHNAVRVDLATLRSSLQLRSQVVVLYGGMEREAGFPELKRRLGPKVASEQQFGKGYNPHCPAIDEELAAVAQHACGAFEDWTYHLFAQKGERLSNPRGNRQLYALVCKIRSLQQRLENIIVKGFAANGDSSEKPHLFSGCYFAATGDKDDRRAFVAGVFKNRLLAQDEDVEWTSGALAENDRYQWIANLLVALDVLLVGGIVAMAVMGWNQK